MCRVPVAVCVYVMDGWVRAVLCVLFSYNSIVSASTVFSLSARALLPFTLSCSYSCSYIFFFCTRSQFYLFLSFPWNCPSTVILLCHPLSYSFIWVFFHSVHLSRSLISLSLFHIVLQSYQTGLTYIHSRQRDPFQKRLLLPRQQIFSLQILQDVVTAHLRVKWCCQPFVCLTEKQLS